MSISSTNNRIDHIGNNVTHTFSFLYRIFEDSDLQVIVVNPDTNSQTTLTLDTHYTVSGAGSSSGSITLIAGAFEWIYSGVPYNNLKLNWGLTIKRVLPLVQETDIRNQGAFYPEIHEDQFDKSIMIAQQQDEEISRSVKLPTGISSSEFDPTLPSDIALYANSTIVVNPTADGFMVGPTTDEISSAQTYATQALASKNSAANHKTTAERWATYTSGTVVDAETSVDSLTYSAKEFAQGTQTGTGGSSKDWATKTSAAVTGTSYSSKEHAIGTQTRGASGGGSSKDWANYTGGTVDNSEYSAKKYATDSQTYAGQSSASAALAAAYASASQWSDVVYLTYSSSPYTVQSTDTGKLFSINATAGNVVINLPSIAGLDLTGPYSLGFLKTDSSTNTVTINGNGTDKIQGASSLSISTYKQGANLIPDIDASPDEWTALEFGNINTLYSPTINSGNLVTPSTDIITFDGQASAPSNPSSGFYKAYIKDSTGKLTVLDSSGVEKSAGGVSSWVTSTPYAVGDLVLYGNKIYVCVTAHTSSSFIETDIIAQKWVLESNPVVARNSMTYGFDAEDNDTGGWTTAKHSGALTNGFPTSVGSAGAALSSSTSGYTTATTMSFASTSTNPLFGSYSYNISTSSSGTTVGDMAISPVYNIPLGDRGSTYTIKHKYKLVTDTNSLTVFSGLYSTSTLGLAIYDVTNAAWIQPAGCYNYVTKSVAGTFSATWQIPTTCSQYQVVIFTPYATGATTISFLVDEFYCGSQVSAIGPAMSNLKPFTTTLTNFGNGTASLAYKQEGDLCKIKGVLIVGSSLPSGSQIGFTLPSGFTADYTNIPKGLTGADSFQRVGLATAYAPNYFTAAIIRSGTSLTTFYMTGDNTTYGATSGDWSTTTPITWTSGDTITIDMEVPISGFSSNTVSSADYNLNGVTSVYGMSANQTITAGGTRYVLNFDTKVIDQTGSVTTGAAWKFYAPTTGNYVVSLVSQSSATNLTLTAQFLVEIYKNGSAYAYIGGDSQQASSAVIHSACGTTILPLNAGDYIDLRAAVGGSVNLPMAGTVSITKQQGSPIVQATDTVAGRVYASAGGQVVTSSPTLVQFNTKSYDLTNSYSTSTNTLTIPISGKYLFGFYYALVSNTWTAGLSSTGYIYKNGSAVTSYINQIPATGYYQIQSCVTDEIDCLAGNTINIYVDGNSSNTMTLTNNKPTFFWIRVGN